MVKLWSSKPSLWVRFPFPLFVLIVLFLNFFLNSLFSIFNQNKNIVGVFMVLFSWFFNLLLLSNTSKKTIMFKRFELEKFLFNKCSYMYILDVFILFYARYYKQQNINLFGFKLKNLNNGNFYTSNNVLYDNTQTMLYGIRSI